MTRCTAMIKSTVLGSDEQDNTAPEDLEMMHNYTIKLKVIFHYE